MSNVILLLVLTVTPIAIFKFLDTVQQSTNFSILPNGRIILETDILMTTGKAKKNKYNVEYVSQKMLVLINLKTNEAVPNLRSAIIESNCGGSVISNVMN